MHSVYLGTQAFISAAGGSTSLSSKDLCSLTEFIWWLPAPLLSTLWHPLAFGASSSARSPGGEQKAEKAEKPCSCGVHGITAYEKHVLPLFPCKCPLLCGDLGGEEEGPGLAPSEVFLKATQ